MAGKCHGCEILENYKYWCEFPSTKHKFFKIMMDDFHHALIIPLKFVECFKEKLAPWCTLVGPSENKWRVNLSRTEDEKLAFLDGWEKFVNDHGVEEYDFLVFNYVGNSSFDVIVFDKSGCEREGSHFANNNNERSNSPRITCTSTLHGNGNSSEETNDVLEVDAEIISDSEEEIKEEEQEMGDCSWDSEEFEHEFKPTKKGRSGNSRGKIPQTQKYHISKRRMVTIIEKKRAAKLATDQMSKNPSVPKFEITLLPTHVYKGFYLTIPKDWAMEHMIQESHDVELRVPQSGRSWKIRCRWTLTRSRQCQFGARWEKFVLENNLEEHDACVFELIQKGDSKLIPIFNVKIFRVVNDIVPLIVSRGIK